ncbi:type II toxin-antitoxin system RelE/ParE family toxin [Acidisoma cellulosilytica]|uniref:Type II toxin-antitoxin system RelE/ParE family toxin n=1 Tax=Acidisoma cellulosilyticum TaxID=2802395 RepID=A0A964E3G5_9PROT|nr:type II toxin-antitoxin system RelE/ParE family toxin [Acidisoma cellulosilyticum]MCB8880247.1 type II toxin-antitoxin system RelE/ParE family toxin [Acidisoma cellulosilyticum]
MELRRTREFADWLDRLTDQEALRRIIVRLARLEAGLFGDVRPVGDGVSELRVDYGPGYRVYFVQRGRTLIVLLCGGDKRNQDRDIKWARRLAASLEN